VGDVVRLCICYGRRCFHHLLCSLVAFEVGLSWQLREAGVQLSIRACATGLASKLRFAASPAHLKLLLAMVDHSPALAAAVLARRELSPAGVDGQSALLRGRVAISCLHQLSQSAHPAHLLLADASSGNVALCDPGPFTAFLASVFPPNLSKVRSPSHTAFSVWAHLHASLSGHGGHFSSTTNGPIQNDNATKAPW
jgi:hypothetical protein